jgi:flagella basal body P-ring formation protein FlgA
MKTAFLLFSLALIGAAQAEVAVVPAGSAAADASRAATARADLTNDQLLPELSRQLSEHFRVVGDLQIELLRPWTPGVEAGAAVELTVLDFPSTLSSSLLVRVRLQSAGRPLGDTTLALRAQLLRDVWVTREPVARGNAVEPAQLDSRRVDVLRERDSLATGESESLTFTRSVPAGRVLTWRDVARRALVRKGQVIEVAATDGALTITMKALAMENGAAGETVKVRNLESRREFAALVVSESRAQVRF